MTDLDINHADLLTTAEDQADELKDLGAHGNTWAAAGAVWLAQTIVEAEKERNK